MRHILAAVLLLVWSTSPVAAYVEAPHTLGRCVSESTTIVLMEVTKVNAEKNLILFKKIADIKGKHPADEVRHNIGKGGFHEREWKNIMAWAEPGKKAVFMYNGDASETCIGNYWYQAYRQGDWWGMSHAEPFLLRTYVGDVEKLADYVARILKNEEVIVPCFADGNKALLHERKGKLQRLKASLKRIEYNPKRDFVGWGGDGEEVDEFKTVTLLPEGSPSWKYLPAKALGKIDDRWVQPQFEDVTWKVGKTPIGYGEEEIAKRKGTEILEKGEDFVFRRSLEIPAELLSQKGVIFNLNVASDDNARVWINGVLVDQDPEEDHEFAYWNREVEIPIKILKPGHNLIAVRVKNKANSSDLYLDMEVLAQVPLPKKAKPKTGPSTVVIAPKETPKTTPVSPVAKEEPRDPDALKIDAKARTLTLKCEIATRKLPNLPQEYPIEVIATWPAPRGQKAHETIVSFKGIKPGEVQKAIQDLGVKPGKPAYGENAKATGPEVKILLEFIDKDGKIKQLPIEQALVQKDGKPVPAIKWYFTGTVLKQPDPEKDDVVPGADLTGTLISLFPVTDATIFQSQFTMKDESVMKLDTNRNVLPKEGTAAKLVIILP